MVCIIKRWVQLLTIPVDDIIIYLLPFIINCKVWFLPMNENNPSQIDLCTWNRCNFVHHLKQKWLFTCCFLNVYRNLSKWSCTVYTSVEYNCIVFEFVSVIGAIKMFTICRIQIRGLCCLQNSHFYMSLFWQLAIFPFNVVIFSNIAV